MKGEVKKNRKAAQAANAGRRGKRRRSRRTLHHALVLLFVLAAGAVLCLTVFFKIEDVVVVGTDKYDPLEVAANSGVQLEDNLLRISKEEIAATLLEQYPYIESVEVLRRIPSTVEIHITQCVPAGVVKEGEDYVLFTGEGKVLERGIMYIPENILLILGLDTAGVEPGEYLGAWVQEPVPEEETEAQKAARLARDTLEREHAEAVKERLIMLEYLMEGLEESEFVGVTNVDLSNRLNMSIMYENRLEIKLGSESGLIYKLDFLRHIIEEELPGNARGILNAADAQLSNKIFFKPASDYSYVSASEWRMADEEEREEELSDSEKSMEESLPDA